MVSPKRILCTEDDPDTRDLLHFILRDAGYEVATANTAEDALTLAKDKSFDLYIVDNWLAGMSGVELTVRIRRFDSSTPILFYSGAVVQADRSTALAAGAQSYLIKPSNADDLIREVARCSWAKNRTCRTHAFRPHSFNRRNNSREKNLSNFNEQKKR